MHRLVVLAIIAALGAPARAEFGVSMAVHASSYGGLEEGGGGVMLEVSGRRGRIEYFGDLGVALVSGRRDGMGLGEAVDATLLGGVRLIAREFRVDEMAFALAIDLFAGGEQIRWSGEDVTRPQVGAGLGYMVGLTGTKKIRIMTRVFAAPMFGERDEPVCRGACPESSREASYGFMGLFGASW
ncbi:MAG: hypothetical protein ABI175_07550 [Polyangiales bacterium]